MGAMFVSVCLYCIAHLITHQSTTILRCGRALVAARIVCDDVVLVTFFRHSSRFAFSIPCLRCRCCRSSPPFFLLAFDIFSYPYFVTDYWACRLPRPCVMALVHLVLSAASRRVGGFLFSSFMPHILLPLPVSCL